MNISTHFINRGSGAKPTKNEENIFKSDVPNKPQFDQYKVKLGDRFTPVMDEFHDRAAQMDKNNNGIISSDEILPPVSRIGHAQVHQPDFTWSYKHKLAGWANPWAEHYPSTAEMHSQIDELSAKNPGMIQRVKLGETAEGRDILAYRLGKGPEGEKPGVLVVGGQHAREWAGGVAVLESMEKMLDGYGKDAEITQNVDGMEMWFVPMANPDGYEYSRNADPDWRKNRSVHPGYDGIGTDLNRNYSKNYRYHTDVPKRVNDDIGASDDAEHLTFRGPHALSENETQVLTDFMDTRSNLKGVLDVHSFGRMILYPGGENEERNLQYQQAADKMNAALDEVKYTTLATSELYTTSGDMTAYSDQLGLFSMVLEVGRSFQPHPDRKDAVTARASNAIVAFIDQVADDNLGGKELGNIVG